MTPSAGNEDIVWKEFSRAWILHLPCPSVNPLHRSGSSRRGIEAVNHAPCMKSSMIVNRALTNVEVFPGDIYTFLYPENLTAQPELLCLLISSYVRAEYGRSQELIVWINV